jgi:hypothetical protein
MRSLAEIAERPAATSTQATYSDGETPSGPIAVYVIVSVIASLQSPIGLFAILTR